MAKRDDDLKRDLKQFSAWVDFERRLNELQMVSGLPRDKCVEELTNWLRVGLTFAETIEAWQMGQKPQAPMDGPMLEA